MTSLQFVMFRLVQRWDTRILRHGCYHAAPDWLTVRLFHQANLI
jgi:hypothetical protein